MSDKEIFAKERVAFSSWYYEKIQLGVSAYDIAEGLYIEQLTVRAQPDNRAPVSEPIAGDEDNPMISVRLLHYQSLVRKAAAATEPEAATRPEWGAYMQHAEWPENGIQHDTQAPIISDALDTSLEARLKDAEADVSRLHKEKCELLAKYEWGANKPMVVEKPLDAEAWRDMLQENFERQDAGFKRCYEALGITDDRERSWSALLLAIKSVPKRMTSNEIAAMQAVINRPL